MRSRLSPLREPTSPAARRSVRVQGVVLVAGIIAALVIGIAADRIILPAISLNGLTTTGQQLPSAIQSSKVIRVASYLGYPGVESLAQGAKQPQGIDVDLCQAIAQQFGNVRCQFSETPTQELIPTLQSARADIVMSGLGDSIGREQQIDLIDYYSPGLAFVVARADVAKYRAPTDLCGHAISVQFALQAEFAIDLAGQCKSLKKADLTIVAADLTALQQGKVSAALADYPTAMQLVRQRNNLGIAGARLVRYATNPDRIVAPWGIGVRKDDPALRDAVMTALRAIMANGAYDRILAKWGASAGALKTPQLNCSSTATCPTGS